MIRELLYDYYKNENGIKREQAKEVNFAPSYFSKCKRQIFYRKTGVNESNPISEASLLKMAFGNAIHDKLQRVLEDLGYLKTAEVEKSKEYKGLLMKWRNDGELIIDDEKIIIEIKSKYAAGMKAIENQPNPDDVLQLVLYLELEEIETGVLLYAGRDNGFLIEYVIKKGDDLYLDTLKTIDRKSVELDILKQMIEQKCIPGRDFNIQLKNKDGDLSEKFQKDKVAYKSDWQCSYCQWKDLCWKDELEKIKDSKFYIYGKFI